MRSIRKKIGWSFVSVVALYPLFTVSVLSFQYSVSPIYATKALAREIALRSISLAVSLTTELPAMSCATGPAAAVLAGPGKVATTASEVGELVAQLFPGKRVSVDNFNNRPLCSSRYPFGYQPVSEARLAKLRKEFSGQEKIAASGSDFEQLLQISDWVNRQWKHGTSGVFNPNHFDASTILSQSKKGATFWCHVSAMTLIQVAASMGFQGRLVSLSRDGYSREHAVTEFWSNSLQKWVMIDPDFNIHYRFKGIPQNVLEIHTAFMGHYSSHLEVVRGTHRPVPELEGRIASLPSYYRYFNVDMRNDWLTNRFFPGHPARSDKATLFWVDRTLPPVLHFHTSVSNPCDLYWDLNKVHLRVWRPNSEDRSLEILLETNTPNFSFCEVQVDRKRKIEVKEGSFSWIPHRGCNVIKVRSVNASNQRGPWSALGVTVAE